METTFCQLVNIFFGQKVGGGGGGGGGGGARLGVKYLSSLNKKISCKWSWRYATKKGTLWIDVIKGKFGEEEGGGGGGGGAGVLVFQRRGYVNLEKMGTFD